MCIRDRYEIAEKISELNYKIYLDKNTTAVIHVNRLKKATASDKHPKSTRRKPQQSADTPNDPHAEVPPTGITGLESESNCEDELIIPVTGRQIPITMETIDTDAQATDSEDETIVSEHARDSDYEPDVTLSPDPPGNADAVSYTHLDVYKRQV